MLCRDIIKTKKEVQRLRPEDSSATAARLMRDHGIGFLPVCNESGMVIGVLTDRDIALRLVADDKPASTVVREIMTAEVVFCHPRDDLRDVELIMAERKKSRIMCIDNGTLVGVISLSDIAMVDNSGRAAETLRQISARETRPS